jgi:hypothetical protein
MGLLDDAIREHLELKRLRGADPGAVAREEQDALGAVPHGDQPAQGPDVGDVDDGFDASFHDGEQSLAPAAESTRSTDSTDVGQETVEINMEAELAGEGDFEQVPRANDVERGGSAQGKTISDESLEWEVPGDHAQDSEHGGAKTEKEPHGDHAGEADEPVEDVLEETPDFLRDTPEQERLWFEQRPPRDFDFNE